MTWQEDLDYLHSLEKEGNFKEAKAFKERKWIIEMWELEEEKLSNLKDN